jgi:hypothetical protein
MKVADVLGLIRRLVWWVLRLESKALDGCPARPSREQALEVLAEEPFVFLTLFKKDPPECFWRAFAESLCEAMAEEGFVPDAEMGWIEGEMSLSEATEIVFNAMLSNDLEHPLVTGISEVLDDHDRARVFVEALYDKCGGYLIRTSDGLVAVVPDPQNEDSIV